MSGLQAGMKDKSPGIQRFAKLEDCFYSQIKDQTMKTQCYSKNLFKAIALISTFKTSPRTKM